MDELEKDMIVISLSRMLMPMLRTMFKIFTVIPTEMVLKFSSGIVLSTEINGWDIRTVTAFPDGTERKSNWWSLLD